MLDFSWIEFLVIVIIGVLVIGPKDLPAMLYQLGKVVRRLQYMRFALSHQFDDFMQQAELHDPNKKYEKPAPVYEQEEAESPFAKEPFHQQGEYEGENEEEYDPDMDEDEEYVENELSFLKDLRQEREER